VRSPLTAHRCPRPVPLGSGRLAKDQAEWLTTGEAARQRELWLDRLTPPFPRLADGPGSRFAEPGTASFVQRMRSATTSAKLSADDMRTVSAAARKHGMTDFMLVLGAYAATLRAWSGQGRTAVRAALQASNHVQGAGRRAVRRDHDRRTDHRDGPT